MPALHHLSGRDESSVRKPNLPPGSAPLLPKHLFRGLPGIVHLAAGGETPPLLSHLDAAERFLADKAGGMPGRHRFGETLAASRLELGAGDNVVVARSEFWSGPERAAYAFPSTFDNEMDDVERCLATSLT